VSPHIVMSSNNKETVRKSSGRYICFIKHAYSLVLSSHLSSYSCKYSRRDHTQHQILTLLLFKDARGIPLYFISGLFGGGTIYSPFLTGSPEDHFFKTRHRIRFRFSVHDTGTDVVLFRQLNNTDQSHAADILTGQSLVIPILPLTGTADQSSSCTVSRSRLKTVHRSTGLWIFIFNQTSISKCSSRSRSRWIFFSKVWLKSTMLESYMNRSSHHASARHRG